MVSLPHQTAEIFDFLSKGSFLNINSTNPVQREWYYVMNQHEEAFRTYFRVLNLSLSGGEGYYFFSRKMPAQKTEEKLEQIRHYKNWLDFLLSCQPALGPGSRIRVEEIANKVSADRILRKKMENLYHRNQPLPVAEKIRAIFSQIEKAGFMQSEDDSGTIYRMMASFSYLKNLVEKIPVP